jgi:Cupredoxin-like domain
MTASPRLIPRNFRGYTLIGAVVLGAGTLSSCGGSSDASNAAVVEVELGRYTITPSPLIAPAGALELVVTNVDDALIHNLVVNGKGTKSLAPGESQTLPMGEVGAGDYQMWCDVQGHRQMGQTGTMRVEPAPTPASPSAPGT